MSSSRAFLIATIVALVPIADGALAAERSAVPTDIAARAIFNQAEGVSQGARNAARLKFVDVAKARGLEAEAIQVRNEAARGNGTRELLARLDDISQRLRNATGEGQLFGNGDDGGYYPAGYEAGFPR
ncbi:MAG TPA: hypothetical protein VGV39_30525 [Mesorhizobium sp.]|uniref:hypothetical protein n=1 Tax=Mesorhizobium sp. TaxID=1871066 RepID=UPI002DDCE6B5|nr:hypothetical protein [Mesorhizobium sp.]HEV2507444.1 hypothetical protein [Mesorhizobium sp.]